MDDHVKIEVHFGKVIRCGIRAIKLRTLEEGIVTIPHNVIWNEANTITKDSEHETQVNVDFLSARPPV